MRLSENDIRRIALAAIDELGDNASPENVKKVVASAIKNFEDEAPIQDKNLSSGRIMLTSFGINRPGIVAAITSSLSASGCDIQDVSQKLMHEFFTMIMLVDISAASKDLKEIQEDMNKIASELKIKIFLQHEDIFRYMHRI